MRNDEARKKIFCCRNKCKITKENFHPNCDLYIFFLFALSHSLSSHRRRCRHLRNDERSESEKKNLDRLVSEHKNWGSV